MDGLIPCVIEPDKKAKPNRNWARMIQEIVEVDPLTCLQCRGVMWIIIIIEDQEVIDKILVHLGLGQTNRRPPPKSKSLKIKIDYSDSRFSFYEESVVIPGHRPEFRNLNKPLHCLR